MFSSTTNTFTDLLKEKWFWIKTFSIVFQTFQKLCILIKTNDEQVERNLSLLIVIWNIKMLSFGILNFVILLIYYNDFLKNAKETLFLQHLFLKNCIM